MWYQIGQHNIVEHAGEFGQALPDRGVLGQVTILDQQRDAGSSELLRDRRDVHRRVRLQRIARRSIRAAGRPARREFTVNGDPKDEPGVVLVDVG